MQITSANQHHETAIKALLKECDLPFEDLTSAHFESFFIIKNGSYLEAVIGLELCGDLGLLRSLAVIPSKRGQGWAIQLVNELETYARHQQIAVLYLLTTTADVFFAKLGYQRISRTLIPKALRETAEFKSICPASAICMWKQL